MIILKSCLLSVCLIFATAILSNANEYPPSRAATAAVIMGHMNDRDSNQDHSAELSVYTTDGGEIYESRTCVFVEKLAATETSVELLRIIDFNNLGNLVYEPGYGKYIVPGVGPVETWGTAVGKPIIKRSSNLILTPDFIKDKLRALHYMKEHFCPGL